MKLPSATIITQSQGEQVTLALKIAQDNLAFAGHFPGEPILPGVVQLDWALQAARVYLNLTAFAARDFRIKFHNIIRPDMPVSLHLQSDQARGRLDFTYKSGETVLSAGQIRFGVAS